MASDTITHDSGVRLIEAGAIRTKHAIGQNGGWGISFKDGTTEQPLAAQRGNVRIFRRLETLVTYLREIGIVQFDVDAGGYDTPRHQCNEPTWFSGRLGFQQINETARPCQRIFPSRPSRPTRPGTRALLHGCVGGLVDT